MSARWDAVMAGRNPPERSKPPTTSERTALQMLTTSPEWAVFLTHMRDRDWVESAASDVGDASALLRQAGRRSFLRDLEGLAERVSDERRGEPER